MFSPASFPFSLLSALIGMAIARRVFKDSIIDPSHHIVLFWIATGIGAVLFGLVVFLLGTWIFTDQKPVAVFRKKFEYRRLRTQDVLSSSWVWVKEQLSALKKAPEIPKANSIPRDPFKRPEHREDLKNFLAVDYHRGHLEQGVGIYDSFGDEVKTPNHLIYPFVNIREWTSKKDDVVHDGPASSPALRALFDEYVKLAREREEAAKYRVSMERFHYWEGEFKRQLAEATSPEEKLVVVEEFLGEESWWRTDPHFIYTKPTFEAMLKYWHERYRKVLKIKKEADSNSENQFLKKLISDIRAHVKSDEYVVNQFAKHDLYRTIEPYLSEECRREQDLVSNNVINFVMSPGGGYDVATETLLNDLARIERERRII